MATLVVERTTRLLILVGLTGCDSLTIRDAVVDGFAFNADALKNVASPELLDRIVSNAFALRLGEPALAEDAYTDLRDQVIRAPRTLARCQCLGGRSPRGPTARRPTQAAE